MLLVKKEVSYCDNIINDIDNNCFIGEGELPGPESDRGVQECNDNFLDDLCDKVNESSFDMIVTDNIEFPGSEKGKKITFNGERYTVSEEQKIGIKVQNEELDFLCQEAGFDSG